MKIVVALLGLSLGTTVAAQGADPAERAPPAMLATRIEGRVLTNEGLPARDAVVTTSGGGTAVTDDGGWFRLELEIQPGVERVELRAFRGSGAALTSAALMVEINGEIDAELGADARPRTPLVPTLTLASGCQPSWVATFGVLPGVSGDPVPDPVAIKAMAVFDDGQGGGPALYLGGNFSRSGGIERPYLAKWTRQGWEAVGGGVDGFVESLLVFDDGSGGGPELYVGGRFTSAGGTPADGIAKWNGTSWSALGSGVTGTSTPAVLELEVFDDGQGGGSALYACGSFTSAGGSPASNIARWDGTAWAALGGGLDLPAYDLEVFDDGAGPGLYAAGLFRSPANRVARWDGTSWSPLGSGVGGANFDVAAALAVFDDGAGPALIVAGNFAVAGGLAVNNLAKWDGAAWSALGSGLVSTFHPEYQVVTLRVHDDGSGPALYAGGQFNHAGALVTNLIARWDGSSWSPLEGGLGSTSGAYVGALTTFDDGSGGGPALFVGGNFSSVDGIRAYGLAKWNGSAWSLPDRSVNDVIYSLAVYDDGRGAALYAGGRLTSAGSKRVSAVARWSGTDWEPLAGGLLGSDPLALAMAVYDDGLGGGPALYVTGIFTRVDGANALRVARWDGSQWSRLGNGLNNTGRALAVFDDGTGPALYAGGDFLRVDGFAASHVAKWNGVGWSAVGGGTNDAVHAFAVFDDQGGAGPALHAGGRFTSAGGSTALGVARWNGVSWSRLRRGIIGDVFALEVFDDGSGPALYAGGDFERTGGGVPVSDIAKWDGQSWSALRGGLTGGVPYSHVSSLAVFDDGRGPALYAAGDFYSASGLLARNLARWEGADWSALGRGVINDVRFGQVHALAVFDDGRGPSLYAGGGFTLALDSLDTYLARWEGCLDTVAPVLACPSSVGVDDPLSGSIGEVVSFLVTATDDRDPSPAIVCVPPSGSVFPPGVTTVRCTASDASGNASACEFPVFVNRRVRMR